MDKIVALLSTKTDLLWAALISAAVSALVTYALKRREIRHQAEIDYEYDQRKKLQELAGRYHGRLLSAANSLNYRLWNLYSNHSKGWLKVDEKYSPDRYYYASTVYRFSSFFALIHQIDSEAILLDARIATRKDFLFLNYVSAFHWVMTDVALFDGHAYDSSVQSDHFFSDHFRHYGRLCVKDRECLNFEEFKKGPFMEPHFKPVLAYFDDLKPDEARFRWDRVVALHLLLLAFINAFGYRRQRTPFKKFCEVARKAKSRAAMQNLILWLPRHDLRLRPGSWLIPLAIRRGAPKCSAWTLTRRSS